MGQYSLEMPPCAGLCEIKTGNEKKVIWCGGEGRCQAGDKRSRNKMERGSK